MFDDPAFPLVVELVVADWLDDHGESEVADRIRNTCGMQPGSYALSDQG